MNAAIRDTPDLTPTTNVYDIQATLSHALTFVVTAALLCLIDFDDLRCQLTGSGGVARALSNQVEGYGCHRFGLSALAQ